MEREEVEVCPYCDREITLRWNVEQDGYQITCPYCGNKIMLCDACMHSDDNPEQKCDWCEEYNCFRKKKETALETVLRRKIDSFYEAGQTDWVNIINHIKSCYNSEIIENNHEQLLKEGLDRDLLVYVPKRITTLKVILGEECCIVYVNPEAKVKVKNCEKGDKK